MSSGAIFPDWPAPARVRAVVTTRTMPGHSKPPYEYFNLGLRSGDDEADVRANREQLVGDLELPSPPRWIHQVHGDRSLRITEEIFDREQMADASFTTQPGTVLAILTADCLPILIAADDGSEIAAIHAGWRGLAAGIVESTVRRLRTPKEKLMAWLGPAIGAASYEVGDEVRDAFVATLPQAARAFAATRSNHWLCDLYALVRQRLRSVGVTRCYGGDFDTFRDAALLLLPARRRA